MLAHIREVGWYAQAVAAAGGISTAYLYQKIEQDPEWKEQVEQAKADYLTTLEREATRRAVQGWDVPVTVAGGREVVRKFSDPLLVHLLKRNAPEKHGDRMQIEQTGKVEVTRAADRFDLSKLSKKEQATLRKLLAKARIEESE